MVKLGRSNVGSVAPLQPSSAEERLTFVLHVTTLRDKKLTFPIGAHCGRVSRLVLVPTNVHLKDCTRPMAKKLAWVVQCALSNKLCPCRDLVSSLEVPQGEFSNIF